MINKNIDMSIDQEISKPIGINDYCKTNEMINYFNILRSKDPSLRNTIFVVIDAEYITAGEDERMIGMKEYKTAILDGFLGALYIFPDHADYRIYGYRASKELDKEFLKKPSEIRYVDYFMNDLKSILNSNPNSNILVIAYYLPAELNFIKYSMLYYAIKNKNYSKKIYIPEQSFTNDESKVFPVSNSFYFKLDDRIHIIDLMTLSNYREGLEKFAYDMFKTSSKKLGHGSHVYEMNKEEIINYNFADCYITAMVFCKFILEMIAEYEENKIRFRLFNENNTPLFTIGSIAQDIILQLYDKDEKSHFFKLLQDIQKINNNSCTGAKKEKKVLKELNKYYNYGGKKTYLKRKMIEIQEMLKTFEERYSGGGFIDNINDRPVLFNGSLIDFTSLYPFSMLELLNVIGIRLKTFTGNFNKRDILRIYRKHKNAFIAVDYAKFKENVTFPFPHRVKSKEDEDDDSTMSVVALESKASIQTIQLLYQYLNYIDEIHFKNYYVFEDNFVDSKVYKFVFDLLQKRLITTDDARKVNIKSILNVLYGKYAQQKPKPSKIYLPLISSGITAISREIMIKAIRFLERHNYKVLATATDSIIFESNNNNNSNEIIDELNKYMLDEYKNIQLSNFVPFKIEYVDNPILYVRLKFYIIFNKNFNLPKNSKECLDLINGIIQGNIKLNYKDVVAKFKTLGLSIYNDDKYKLLIALLYLYYYYLIEEGVYDNINDIKLKNFNLLESPIGIKVHSRDNQLSVKKYYDLMLKRYTMLNSIDQKVKEVLIDKLKNLGYKSPKSLKDMSYEDIKKLAIEYNIDVDKIRKKIEERIPFENEFSKRVKYCMSSVRFLKRMDVYDNDGEIELKGLLFYHYLIDFSLLLPEPHIKFHTKQHGPKYPIDLDEKKNLQERGNRLISTIKSKLNSDINTFNDIVSIKTITYKGFPVKLALLDAPFIKKEFKSLGFASFIRGDDITDYGLVYEKIWDNVNEKK